MLTAEQWMDERLYIAVRVEQAKIMTLRKLEGYIGDEEWTDHEAVAFVAKMWMLIDKMKEAQNEQQS